MPWRARAGVSRTSGIIRSTNGSIRPKTISTQKDTANHEAAEHGVGGAAIKKIAHLKGEEEPDEPGLDSSKAGEQIHARSEAEPTRGGEVFEDRHRRTGHHGGK